MRSENKRERKKKKGGDMECSFNQLPSGSARLFFTMFLFVWHASSFFFLSAKFLTFLSIAYRLLFRFYCAIHLFFLPSISLLLNGNCQAPLKVDEETIREKGELFIRHTKTTPKEKENKEGRGLHILKWNTRQCCTCH